MDWLFHLHSLYLCWLDLYMDCLFVGWKLICLWFIVLSRTPQERDMWSCNHHRNATNDCCRGCRLCQNTAWSPLSEYCLGSTSEWGGQEEVLQKLVQVKKEGLFQVFKEAWQWWREEGYASSVGENEEVLHCYSGFGSYTGLFPLLIHICEFLFSFFVLRLVVFSVFIINQVV